MRKAGCALLKKRHGPVAGNKADRMGGEDMAKREDQTSAIA